MAQRGADVHKHLCQHGVRAWRYSGSAEDFSFDVFYKVAIDKLGALAQKYYCNINDGNKKSIYAKAMNRGLFNEDRSKPINMEMARHKAGQLIAIYRARLGDLMRRDSF